MKIEILKDLNFIQKVYERNSRVLVLFIGDFSQSSKTLQYYLSRLPEDSLNGFKLFSCDADVSLTVRKSENITTIPSFKVFVEGKAVKYVTNIFTPREIVDLLNSY